MTTKLPPQKLIPVAELPKCQITDEYILGHIDATFIRNIEYSNTNSTSAEIPIILSSIKIEYSLLCGNFLCKINDEKTDLVINEGNFLQTLKFKPEDDCKLKRGETLKVVIECRWKNFVRFLDDFYFTFKYPDKAEYKLIINNFSLKDMRHIILKKDGVRAVERNDYFIGDNSVDFNKITIEHSDSVKIRMITMSTPKELPVFSVFSNTDTNKFSDYIIILIQHLLSDFVHFAESFVKNGAEKKNIFIIGIPYSTKEKTVTYLKREGYLNIEAPKEYPFDGVVKSTMLKAIDLSNKDSKKILIVEDGGYATPILHKELMKYKDNFIGAVEQTANGIWRDKDIKEKDKTDYIIPIINVAESEIKDKLESPLIGKAICRNVELLMGKESREISGKKVAIMGFGRTGSKIAEVLKLRGANVKIFDKNNVNLALAKDAGYTIASDPKDLVANRDLIIEATGVAARESWCNSDEILAFENGSYFLSASSKRLGINYDDLDILIKQDSKKNLPGIGVRYTLQNDNSIILLADGYPVNFFLGESVPDRAIAFIFALLFKSAEFIVDNQAKISNGIVDINKVEEKYKNEELVKLQQEIAKKHLTLSN